MNFRRFWAVLLCRNREFLRDWSSLTWNFLLPLSLMAGFTVAFSGPNLYLYKVGVLGGADLAQNSAFFQTRYVQFIPVSSLAAALPKVERHQLDLLIEPASRRYWINEQSPKGYLLERILRGADAATSYHKQTVSGRVIRYVDWVAPGILAMNMMFSCLFGVGYVIVRYRKNGVLKRLKATPLTPLEFLSAQIASRLWLALTSTILVFAGAQWALDLPMHGSYWLLLLVFLIGAISLISLGLIIAARTTSDELAAGLLNALSWPMTFLSGVWFSLEGVHPTLQFCARFAPLTHIIDAARAIMLEGANLAAVSGHLLVLSLMSLASLVVAAWLFRWE